MTITPDTNLLVRLIVLDDAAQTDRARAELEGATRVVLTLPALCEFCWVLKSRYRFSADQIATAVTSLADAANATVDHESVAAGVKLLRAGGDFADAVIADQGRRQGSRVFVSFDRKAVKLVAATGIAAREPS